MWSQAKRNELHKPSLSLPESTFRIENPQTREVGRV